MPTRMIRVPINVCNRCGHEWPQRLEAKQKPKRCPKCKSPYWDTERTRSPRP